MLRNYEAFGPSLDNSEIEIDLEPGNVKRSGLPAGLTARAYMTRHMQAWTEASEDIRRAGSDDEALWSQLVAIGNRFDREPGASFRLAALSMPRFSGLSAKAVELEARAKTTAASLLDRAREVETHAPHDRAKSMAVVLSR
jgi:hypothetical protein